MTLSVRSSSLNDTTSLQRFGMAGALAASILVVGFAVQAGPLVGTRSIAADAAVSNTGYAAAPGISDPAGEHIGLGAVSNTGYAAAPGISDPAGEHIGLGAAAFSDYRAAVGISDPAGEHTGWGQPLVDFDDYRGWQQAPSQAVNIPPDRLRGR